MDVLCATIHCLLYMEWVLLMHLQSSIALSTSHNAVNYNYMYRANYDVEHTQY